MIETIGKSHRPRRAITGLLFAFVAALAVPMHPVHAEPADATETVRGFYGVLLRTMQEGRELGPQGRYSMLEPAIAKTFDITFMAQAAVGPAWSRLSESQQERLTAAFKRYVVATYADNFDDYGGQALLVTGEKEASYGRVVESRITRKDGSPIELNYLVAQDGAGWRIRDVYMAGTISQTAVRRSQFVSILSRSGFDGLIQLLQDKADKVVKVAGL